MTDRRDGEANGYAIAMTEAYFEHVLDARDVCANCHRKNRIERVDPVMSRSGLRHELDSHFSRMRRRTVVDYHDGTENPPDSKGVWCECGVEGSHDRIWDPSDVDRERFKSLLKNTIQSLQARGVSLKSRETAMYALSHFDEHGDVDKALAAGVDAGIVAATAEQ